MPDKLIPKTSKIRRKASYYEGAGRALVPSKKGRVKYLEPGNDVKTTRRLQKSK